LLQQFACGFVPQPENLLVDLSQSPPLLKLCDFGASRTLEDCGGAAAVPMQMMVPG
jgi:serine/threonine protein kinase